MTFASPMLCAPELIVGLDYKNRSTSTKTNPLVIKKTQNGSHTVELGEYKFDDLHPAEILNIAGVIGFDLEISQKIIKNTRETIIWVVDDVEKANVLKLIAIIKDPKLQNRSGGGKGFA